MMENKKTPQKTTNLTKIINSTWMQVPSQVQYRLGG